MPKLLEIIIIIVAVSALIVLFINAINPKFLWKKFESWKATSEPTKAYFITRRLTSIIGIIILLVFLLGPTMHSLFRK